MKMNTARKTAIAIACIAATFAPILAQDAADPFKGAEKKLKIAFGTQLPPYVIRDVETLAFVKLPPYVIPEGGMGMEMDIVCQALKEEGYAVEPVFLRHENIKEELAANPVDGISPCNEEAGIENMHYSASHISYHNAAMTTKDTKFKIKSAADLSDKKVYAFQNAKIYLGPDFKHAVENNKEYSEIPLRGRHMNTAMNEKDAVIVMDRNIFNYYLASHIALANAKNNFIVNDIFQPTQFKVAFKDEAVRDAFNKGLEKLRKDGKYQRIVEQYELLMQKRVEEAEQARKGKKDEGSWF